jgi:two-component system response regulator RegA
MDTPQRLLIVEDDPVFSGVLARTLGKRGYDVAEAGDLPQVRAIAASFAPHYAVVDLKLPGESGLKVVEYLAQLVAAPRIVVLTGYASIATAIEAIRLGAIHYLAKPANADEVLAALLRDSADADLDVQPATPTVGRLEWEHIQKVLAEHDGNISATARALKMHRRTLQRKLDKRPPREGC